MPRGDPEVHVPVGVDGAVGPGVAVKRLLLLISSLVGCGCSSMAAVVPVLGERGAESVSIQGTVERIDFQNINKAQGRYTYNVDLHIAHQGIVGSPHESDRTPGEFRVRVHRVYWSALTAAEQAELAPDGPGHAMTARQWQGYTVGDPVTLDVEAWGPGIGVRLPDAAPTSQSP